MAKVIHFLTRNPGNEPVCSCGFRPEILDDPAPVGQQWKAKTAVLEHIDAMAGNVVRFAEAALGTELQPWQQQVLKQALRSPEAPFTGRHAMKYPRAGVRQTEDGRWLLTLWDGDGTVHVIDKEYRTHPDRDAAFTQGWLTIGACRQSGTNLNGMANA